jgi:hypothetical protein
MGIIEEIRLQEFIAIGEHLEKKPLYHKCWA